MKKLRFTFKLDGNVDMDAVSGFQGQECKKAMQPGLEALEGTPLEETKKSEYWLKEQVKDKETVS